MDELNLNDSELDFHVRNALKAATEGDSDFYNQLVEVISHKERLVAEEVALLGTCLKAASANGDYVDLCLEMLVNNFMPPTYPRFLELLKQPWGLSRKTQVLDRVHSTLKDISNVVPLSPLRLEKIVRDRMPKIFQPEPEVIVMYMENILRLESGEMGKLVGSTVLVVLMDRLLEFDVEIAWDDILEDDFHKGIFDMELEDLEVPADNFGQDSNENRN